MRRFKRNVRRYCATAGKMSLIKLRALIKGHKYGVAKLTAKYDADALELNTDEIEDILHALEEKQAIIECLHNQFIEFLPPENETEIEREVIAQHDYSYSLQCKIRKIKKALKKPKPQKMMSGSDGPDVAAAAATVAAAAPSGGDNTNAGDPEMKHIWKFIYFDMGFIKSLYGIFVASELMLSLLGLISVSVPKNEGCAYLYSSAYSYYEFTSSSCFIVSLVWYALYVLAITKKLSFVRWDIAEIVWIGFYIFNFLIASSVIAAKACMQGGYKAAAAFGFFCFGVLVAHEFFEIRTFLEKRKSSAGNAQGADDESKY